MRSTMPTRCTSTRTLPASPRRPRLWAPRCDIAACPVSCLAPHPYPLLPAGPHAAHGPRRRCLPSGRHAAGVPGRRHAASLPRGRHAAVPACTGHGAGCCCWRGRRVRTSASAGGAATGAVCGVGAATTSLVRCARVEESLPSVGPRWLRYSQQRALYRTLAALSTDALARALAPRAPARTVPTALDAGPWHCLRAHDGDENDT